MLSNKSFGHGGAVGLNIFCVNSFWGRSWVRNKKAEPKRDLWMPMSIKESIRDPAAPPHSLQYLQVASIYSEDFHLLGYDPTRPDKLEPLHPLGAW